MKKTAQTLFAMAALCGAAAQAQDGYVGLSATTSGSVTAHFGNGVSAGNANDPNSWKLYGGVQLNERFGFEAGLLDSGTFRIGNPASVGGGETTFKQRTLYAAGTVRAPLSDSFTLFGKAGIAHNRVSIDSSLAPVREKDSYTRPMLGVGVDYKIGKQVSAVLEYANYGKSDRFKRNQVEAGLKYSF